jgi:hypothetical protein
VKLLACEDILSWMVPPDFAIFISCRSVFLMCSHIF